MLTYRQSQELRRRRARRPPRPPSTAPRPRHNKYGRKMRSLALLAHIHQRKKQKSKKNHESTFKRPEGMHREVYALLYSDNKICRDPPALIPSDSNQGYKQMKAKLGRSKVRPWKRMSFTNPARKDGAVFYHWRRVADEGKDYPFARFNKEVSVPLYTSQEYQLNLHDEKWTKQATDHLFDLCNRFDLRWVVVHDRFDYTSYGKRSIEDMKERYYSIINKLSKARADPSLSNRAAQVYDAEHERKRKEQLLRLFNRTQEQVEEEEMLIAELKKIELRKKEREKKTQDLQKLITAADNNAELRRTERKITKKKIQLPQSKSRKELEGSSKQILETGGIKFPDFKQSGVYLRSQKMKLPSSVGQKKTKAIEHLLDELGIPIQPMPTEDISLLYNELRSDMVLLYELKLAHANCEFELQTLRHRYEALAPGKLPSSALSLINAMPPMEDPNEILPMLLEEGGVIVKMEDDTSDDQSNKNKKPVSEIIDVVTTSPSTPRKRRTAIEPPTVVKKIKKL
ncbi:DNA methyltransferase 1-associated protein 1-like isoform X3 [Asterias rubens]|uniref:DNA methyltransferase 1-associated protein 1-like isoform X3 n=1 Tax=Asterias rubens TaxID=7604 RepID=UPI001455498E|nr:DNA methyltransferase 1-associated protein 1-like isoform X3 [Asterias rubens]